MCPMSSATGNRFRLCAVVGVLAALLLGACDKSPSPTNVASPGDEEIPQVQRRPAVTQPVEPPGLNIADESTSTASETTAAAADAPGSHSIVSNDGAFRVTYIATPSPIPMNAPFELDVTIVTASRNSRPVKIALEVDAIMPEHGHGMNVEPKVAGDGGQFHVENLLFHMPGKWEVHFDITCDGVTSRAQDEIVIN